VGPSHLAEALKRAERALFGTLADPRGQWLLRGPHQEAESELDLSVVHEGRIAAFRIDRTFVDEQGVRWVVDFKTSAHEGTALDAFLDQEQSRYRSQLEQYAHLLRLRDASRPIRLGLYFPLHTAWREWSAEARS
jgi:hypothetical protein